MTKTMSKAQLAPLIKAVAKNVQPLVRRKKILEDKMSTLEKKYQDMLEKQLAKYKAEYAELIEQQELFEAPVRKVTNGYSTEDLVAVEKFEAGTDKDGQPIMKTRLVLKYPETIVPPTPEGTEVAAEVDLTPEPEHAAPFVGVDSAEIPETGTVPEQVVYQADSAEVDDLPFRS